MANLVIMLELNLEYIVSIRNASSYSTYNPVGQNICSINFGLQVMVYDREVSIDEVKNAISLAKSIKSFVDRNMNTN